MNGTNFDNAGVLMRNPKMKKEARQQKVEANKSCKTCAAKTASVGDERKKSCRAKIKIKYRKLSDEQFIKYF